MKELLVLGIGSPFGDDQLGWKVIELLEQSQALNRLMPKRLQLACCDRPGMQLLELMHSAQTVFLIDAVKTEEALGTLYCIQKEDIETFGTTLSTHGLGLAEALKVGVALQVLPQTMVLYGINIGDIPFQFTLSKLNADRVKVLSVQIERAILGVLVL